MINIKKTKQEPPVIEEKEDVYIDEEEKVNELLLELDADDEQDDDFIANLQMHATSTVMTLTILLNI
jgi:hypothetical protein